MENNIEMAHIFEIAETNAENVAKVLSTYYQELKNNELPDELILQLVLQFGVKIWWPDDE